MIKLKSVKKAYTRDSHQSIPPSHTIKIAIKRLKELGEDVIYGLEDVSHLDSMGLPVYRVAAKNLYNEWGKGITKEQCQASALMERVERYSSVPQYRDHIDVVKASFNEIKDKAISRNDFGLLNLHHVLYGKQRVDEIKMDWVPADSLVSGKKVLVPVQCAFWMYDQENFTDERCTTGLASGNTFEEAINHAISEVVERHMLHIMFFNRPPIKQIDLIKLNNPILVRLINQLQRNGFKIIANVFSDGWKLSTISTFIFHPHEKVIFKDYLKCVTSPDPEIALIRAITECAQQRCVDIRINKFKECKKGFVEGISTETLQVYRWLTGNLNKVSLNELSNLSRDDFKEEIELVVKVISEKGYDILAYDLTHPKLGIPTVRIMIPGLQPNFKMRGFSPFSKWACVTPHLKIYDEVMESCKNRKFVDQQIDDIVEIN